MAETVSNADNILNIELAAGSDFDLELQWKDGDGNLVDMTGYQARMHVKSTLTDQSPVLSLTPSMEVSTSKITVSLTNQQTAGLVSGKYIYDLEVYDDTKVYRLVSGEITVSAEVTKNA